MNLTSRIDYAYRQVDQGCTAKDRSGSAWQGKEEEEEEE